MSSVRPRATSASGPPVLLCQGMYSHVHYLHPALSRKVAHVGPCTRTRPPIAPRPPRARGCWINFRRAAGRPLRNGPKPGRTLPPPEPARASSLPRQTATRGEAPSEATWPLSGTQSARPRKDPLELPGGRPTRPSPSYTNMSATWDLGDTGRV